MTDNRPLPPFYRSYLWIMVCLQIAVIAIKLIGSSIPWWFALVPSFIILFPYVLTIILWLLADLFVKR